MRARCQKEALASISAKSEPVTEVRIALTSGSVGCGSVQNPQSSSVIVNPAMDASLTGQTMASPWFNAVKRCAAFASRSAIRRDIPRSIANGNRTNDANNARVRGSGLRSWQVQPLPANHNKAPQDPNLALKLSSLGPVAPVREANQLLPQHQYRPSIGLLNQILRIYKIRRSRSATDWSLETEPTLNWGTSPAKSLRARQLSIRARETTTPNDRAHFQTAREASR